MDEVHDDEYVINEKTDYIQSISSEIIELKNKKNAIILAHNYQLPEIQDVADYTGDSFELARKATQTDANMIIFCGVDFMAESAKILNPGKRVFIPVADARCPMAGMIKNEEIIRLKSEYPEAKIVAYVNTLAETKAISDVCCTSSSAVNIAKNIDAKDIIFVPDMNLGKYVQKNLPEKNVILAEGYCHVHHLSITVEKISELKARHPDAHVVVHPECTPEVISMADFVGSTAQILKYCSVEGEKYIIGTEREMCYRIKKENPDVRLFPVEGAVCHNMKKIELEAVLESLKSEKTEINMPQKIMEKAMVPLKRMLEMG